MGSGAGLEGDAPLPDAGVDLRESLAALAQLGSTRLDLEQLLTQVATCAVRAIPGAEGAGLTLTEDDRADIVVATAPFVIEVDEIQYRIGQGPCILAVATGTTIRSASVGADPRWPRFGGAVARLGVHSVVSLPLRTLDGVVGAMNVYAAGKGVFDDEAVRSGQSFAVPAAIAVQNAQLLARTQRLVARLEAALETRGVVDRAVGIIMSRRGVTARQALARLRLRSQRDHRKVPEVAQEVVDEAVRRARSTRGRADAD